MNSCDPLASAATPLDELDRQIILATQGGLPLVSEPYQQVAGELGISAKLLMARLREMQAQGVIRRIGVVPNHYAIGYVANGMSVWDVDDAQIEAIGRQVGALEAVTHCYQRPRALPAWPYNLFAMVHGRNRDEVQAQVESISALLDASFPGACHQHDVLFSTRILKKSGLRIKSSGQ